jgi:hypothetical protein
MGELMAARRAATAHTIRLTEEPVHGGRIRITVECPDGCARGYLWSPQPEHNDTVRNMAHAAAAEHLGGT